MNHIIYQVDAFTSEPFKGNPAAVMVLNEDKNVEWMGAIAREMNLSETAFLVPKGNGFHLRWFTPEVEVDLCGHATLAAAHILWSEFDHPKMEKINFSTASGELRARFLDGWIELDFPAFELIHVKNVEKISRALDVQTTEIFSSGENLLVELDSEEQVRKVKPDFERIRQLPVQGVIFTSHSENPQVDFVSRYFAPKIGIDEDPVTGSAHCCLGPYWAKKLGRNSLIAHQISSRGGELRLYVTPERVAIQGQAVTVFKAEFKI